ncbi:glycoside hydrolase family 16 protein [Gonapodya prolifera JEL478]|uniref:Glycoside hydrolase family 16 protein n=1 Tax=Gonapodya prolifera (strain JEL478) TaxID=1344416 RepID=A0A139AXE4_GONPJ|nr:glycoside hydrolase family 16 protein [Gonapodya prolifera JEL478]|eukprot:KXS21125.1 glycoside hydrolase family 16 protein [Gonapodya prolifera JEL478]
MRSLAAIAVLALAGFSWAAQTQPPTWDPANVPACESMKVSFASLNPSDLAVTRSQFTGQTFVNEEETNNVALNNGNLEIKITKGGLNTFNRSQGVGATVTWNRMFKTGRVCIRAKAAKGGGIVTAFFTIAKDLPQGDEIDVEWVGKDMARVQSAYYKGGVADYCNGGYHEIPGGDASADFHEYCIERCNDWFAWYVDGQNRRTVYRTDNCDANWLGADQILVVGELWDGGSGNPGTALWSGGPTDWSDPNNPNYKMTISDFSAQCGCDGFTKPPQPDFNTIACENLPGDVDPFTGGDLPPKPVVPVPGPGCWLPTWHYKNLTCHAVPNWTAPDTAVCDHGTRFYNSNASVPNPVPYTPLTSYSMLSTATPLPGSGAPSSNASKTGASVSSTTGSSSATPAAGAGSQGTVTTKGGGVARLSAMGRTHCFLAKVLAALTFLLVLII